MYQFFWKGSWCLFFCGEFCFYCSNCSFRKWNVCQNKSGVGMLQTYIFGTALQHQVFIVSTLKCWTWLKWTSRSRLSRCPINYVSMCCKLPKWNLQPCGAFLMPKPEGFSSSALAALVTLHTFHPHNSLRAEGTGGIPVLQTCATLIIFSGPVLAALTLGRKTRITVGF